MAEDDTSVQSHLFIGLYRRDIGTVSRVHSTTFHWALIPNGSSSPSPENMKYMQMYQIVNDHPEDLSIWESKHSSLDLASEAPSLSCCVGLPPLRCSTSDIATFLHEQIVEKGDTPLPTSHRFQGWSCALWCIRALGELNEAGLMDLSLGTDREKVEFYRRINSLGMLGMGPPVSWPGQVIENIKFIDLAQTLN